MQYFLSPQHLLILLTVCLFFIFPRSKPPVHPMPVHDGFFLRWIRLFRKN